jgi:hypothetical protein
MYNPPVKRHSPQQQQTYEEIHMQVQTGMPQGRTANEMSTQ